jgi:hypothetical protein
MKPPRPTLQDRADLEQRIHEIRSLLDDADTSNAAGDQRNALYSTTAALHMLVTLVDDLMP